MADTKLQATPTAIPDVLILEPKVFGDNRGWFTESFNAHDFAKATILMWSLCKTTTPSRGSGLCGDCIISSSIPKANWFE
jgi:hypothetical protein